MPSPNKLQSPHTYAIANSAYRAMCGAKTSQSILISGESGAGTRYLVITPTPARAAQARRRRSNPNPDPNPNPNF